MGIAIVRVVTFEVELFAKVQGTAYSWFPLVVSLNLGLTI